MGIVLSQQQAEKVEAEIQRAKTALANIKEKAKEEGDRLLCQAIAGGTAFAAGYANGRYPDKFQKGIFGYAPDLVGAVAVDAAMMFGLTKGMDQYANAGGTGLLCSYANRAGMKAGADAAKKAGEKAGPWIGDPDVSGTVAAEGSNSHSDEQVRHLMAELEELRRRANGG